MCSVINFKLQTVIAPDTPFYTPLYETIIKKCNSCVPKCRMIAGKDNQFVPTRSIEKAVSTGKIKGAFTTLFFLKNIVNTVYELYSSQPFGLNSDAFLSFMFKKGLDKLNNEYGKSNNLYFIPCGISPPEVGGWFQQEITTIQDFQNIKMRITSLGKNIIQGLGGQTVLLPPNEIVPAVKNGIINSVEFSTIEIDDSIGLPDVLNYWYTPAWNQPSTIIYLVFNRKSWFKIDRQRRCQITNTIYSTLYEFYLQDELKNSIIFEKLLSKKREFSLEIIRKMRKVWNDFLDKDENKKIKNEYENMKAYEILFNKYNLAMSKNIII